MLTQSFSLKIYVETLNGTMLILILYRTTVNDENDRQRLLNY